MARPIKKLDSAVVQARMDIRDLAWIHSILYSPPFEYWSPSISDMVSTALQMFLDIAAHNKWGKDRPDTTVDAMNYLGSYGLGAYNKGGRASEILNEAIHRGEVSVPSMTSLDIKRAVTGGIKEEKVQERIDDEEHGSESGLSSEERDKRDIGALDDLTKTTEDTLKALREQGVIAEDTSE